MMYMGFQIVFNISKIKKNLANWFSKYIFTNNLRTRTCIHKLFGRITKATMVHHLIDPVNFLIKIHIADLFQSTFAQVWLNQQAFPEILIICYFRALWRYQEWRRSSVFIVNFEHISQLVLLFLVFLLLNLNM